MFNSRKVLVFIVLTIVLMGSAKAQPSSASTQATVDAPKTLIEYSLPPDKLQKSHALYLQSTRIEVIDTIYSFLMLIALLYFAVGARFRNFAESKSQNKWLQGLIVFPLFILTTTVLSLPSSIYRHHLSVEYGLSVQSWAGWFGDQGKSLGIGIVFGTFILLLLYWIIRLSPRRWWFYGWLVLVPIVVFTLFISPLLIEPLFFKFTPLDKSNPELVTQIERVVKRGGLDIPRDRMFSMNASSKYNGDNAYVSGFGASKRVVVWDTTEKHMTPGEIMFVFGHEMGHYVLNHIIKGLLAAIVSILIFLYLAYRVSGWVLQKWGARWQIRDFADLASVPLLMLLVSIFSFVSNPIDNAYSRHLEHQADTFGLEALHGLVPDSKTVAAQSFQKLGENWLDYPYAGDFYEWWSDNHPLTSKRMRYAQEYDPWSEGKQPEFIKDSPPAN